MSDVAISVEGLGKQYRIGALRGAGTFRERTMERARASVRRVGSWVTRRPSRDGDSADNYIWALEDVSFEIKRGEVVGIIGRNGAGKSTLLKILSRITEPTTGIARIQGQVRSLLEVGTGFHPELTGRDNVYLNGAILGMRKAEIDRKFSEIIDFAGVAKFIDTPVKHYSSGMSVRLAFAVAAHLEPDVLLVDEVLAVGDWDFQKKCLGKMEDVGRHGRTVLLVSHNMTSILNLCPRAILLDRGEVVMDGPSDAVVRSYIGDTPESGTEIVWKDPNEAPGDDNVRMHAVRVVTETGDAVAEFDIARPIHIQIEFSNLRPSRPLYPNVHVKDEMGNFVFASANLPSATLTPDPWADRPLPGGRFRVTCCIPGNLLNAGTYVLDAIVAERMGRRGGAYAEGLIRFRVFDTGEMRREHPIGHWPGAVRPRLEWRTDYLGTGPEGRSVSA